MFASSENEVSSFKSKIVTERAMIMGIPGEITAKSTPPLGMSFMSL